MPTFAYIAAPYGAPTAEGRAENTRRALALAALAVAWGRAPICVHPLIEAGALGDDGLPADRERGIACCIAQVEAVARAGGELWLLLGDGGWISDGCRRELETWERLVGDTRVRRYRYDGHAFQVAE